MLSGAGLEIPVAFSVEDDREMSSVLIEGGLQSFQW
jgi:hypothetical protein